MAKCKIIKLTDKICGKGSICGWCLKDIKKGQPVTVALTSDGISFTYHKECMEARLSEMESEIE